MKPYGGPEALEPHIAALAVSATLAARERANTLAAQGRRVYKLGLGQSPFPVPTTVVDALRLHAAEKDYLPVRGLPALRLAVTDYHRRRHDAARARDDVLIGPGSKELMFLLQLCFPGEILLPVPAWVSYAPQARLARRRARFLYTKESEGFRLRPEHVHAACSGGPAPRLLVLNYPSNPSGMSYDDQQLTELAEVCRQHGLVVLSDEIYGELRFDGGHTSIARYYDEGTILSSGLSKWCGAGGWRLGTFAFPDALRWLADAMASAASETYSTTSAPIQYAAVRAFRGGSDIENYLATVRRILALLLRWAAVQLREAGLAVTEPSGGFYLFPSFEPLRARLAKRGIRDDVELASHLLEDTGVVALPGREFGMPRESLYLRLALVDFDGPTALARAPGRAMDEAFLRDYLTPSYNAVCAIADWANAT